ncbi:MAG: hypothetical protein ACRD0C_14390, partial [Acidimicrobiia bacterium]
DTDGPKMPEWSVEAWNATEPDPYRETGVSALVEPQWSPDGRNLAFKRYEYEFQGHSVIEIDTGRLWYDRGAHRLAWSPGSDRIAVAGPWYGEHHELWISGAHDFGAWDELGRWVGDGSVRFSDVTFAPAGEQLAVLVRDADFELTGVALVGIEDAALRRIDTDGVKAAMAFAPDGTALYYTERRADGAVLVRYDTRSGGSEDVVVLPADLFSAPQISFTGNGNIAVVGRSRVASDRVDGRYCQDNCPPIHSRLLVVSPDGATVSESPDFDRFTAVAVVP